MSQKINRTAEKKVVWTPKENFIWDTSSVAYDARQLLNRGEPTAEELLHVVQRAEKLDQYYDLMEKL